MSERDLAERKSLSANQVQARKWVIPRFTRSLNRFEFGVKHKSKGFEELELAFPDAMVIGQTKRRNERPHGVNDIGFRATPRSVTCIAEASCLAFGHP